MPSASSGLARPRPQTTRSGAAARQRSSWRSTSWPSLSARAGRQQREFRGQVLAVQVGRADLDQSHAEFAGEEARERNLELRVREQEDALAGQLEAVARQRPAARARCRGAVTARNRSSGTARRVPRPAARRRAFGAEREGRGEPLRAARLERARRCRPGTAAPAGSACSGRPPAGRARARRQEAHGPMPSAAKVRRNWSSTTSASAPTTSSAAAPRRGRRQLRHQRGEAGVLALREGGLDAAAGVVQHAHARRERLRQALRPRARGRA